MSFSFTPDQGVPVAETISRYKANPNVLYAEPDYEVHIVDTTPNDLMWPQQWDMTRIAANSAWDQQTDASDVVVAVIDTGIDSTHPDLAGKISRDDIYGMIEER